MFIKLLPNQIPAWKEIIKEGIQNTLPKTQLHAETELLKELLTDKMQCWLLYREGSYKGLFLTKIEDKNELGGKMLTLLCGYAPKGLSGSGAVLEGFETLKKFALANSCDRISFYTDNIEVEKYLSMFPLLWKTHYYQLNLTEI